MEAVIVDEDFATLALPDLPLPLPYLPLPVLVLPATGERVGNNEGCAVVGTTVGLNVGAVSELHVMFRILLLP